MVGQVKQLKKLIRGDIRFYIQVKDKMDDNKTKDMLIGIIHHLGGEVGLDEDKEFYWFVPYIPTWKEIITNWKKARAKMIHHKMNIGWTITKKILVHPITAVIITYLLTKYGDSIINLFRSFL